MAAIDRALHELLTSSMTLVTPEVEIISLHFPKTAGTLFGNLLSQVYGEDKVFYAYKHSCSDSIRSVLSSNIKVIHGHLAHQYVEYFPDAKKIVWLRHPILREISSYFFNKSNPELLQQNFPWRYEALMVQNLSLPEFLVGRNQDQSQLKAEAKVMIEMVGKKIIDFYFVGIHEFFESDLETLQIQLGWGGIQVSDVNRNQYPDYQRLTLKILDDPSLIDQLISLLQKPIQRYQSALDLRAERWGKPKISHQVVLEQERWRLKQSLIQNNLERSRTQLKNIQADLLKYD